MHHRVGSAHAIDEASLTASPLPSTVILMIVVTAVAVGIVMELGPRGLDSACGLQSRLVLHAIGQVLEQDGVAIEEVVSEQSDVAARHATACKRVERRRCNHEQCQSSQSRSHACSKTNSYHWTTTQVILESSLLLSQAPSSAGNRHDCLASLLRTIRWSCHRALRTPRRAPCPTT